MNSIRKICRLPIAMFVGLFIGLHCHAQPFLSNGLIAYYTFSGNINDQSGNGYVGYLNGSTFATDRFGITNDALSFNGTNNTFVVTNLPLLNTSFSYSAWIKIVAPALFDLQSFGAASDGQNQFWNFSFSYSGNQFDLFDTRNGAWGVSGLGTNSPLGAWVHVAITYDSNQGIERLFCNGALMSSRTAQFPLPGPSHNNLYVGTDNGVQDQAFNGLIDDVRVYNRALSSSEVSSLYSFESTSSIPNIVINLTNTYVLAGQNTTMSVTATGGSPLSYQWYFVPNNNSGQAGAYAQIVSGFCYGAVVTNGGFGYGNVPNVSFVGAATSAAKGYATISNGIVTGITVTNAGSGYTSAPVVVIDAPNGYLYGQTNSSLNITNANQNSLGHYFVLVSNSTGSVTSSIVNLTLLYPPSIVQSPVGFTGNFDSSNTLTVAASGTLPLSYQWMLGGTNVVGANGSNYVITNLTLNAAGLYSVQVTNAYGSVTSSPPAVVVLLPSIISPFAGAVEIWGQDTVLNVGAVGSGLLAYQWYFNGEAIDGATNSNYELSSIQFTNAGLYSVVVNSQYGSVTNASYQVVVNPANVSVGLFAGVIIQGTVGNNYDIQSTTNLSDPNSWVTVTNITLASPTQIWNDNSTDVHSPGSPQKYYRVQAGP